MLATYLSASSSLHIVIDMAHVLQNEKRSSHPDTTLDRPNPNHPLPDHRSDSDAAGQYGTSLCALGLPTASL
jgi:hypothetical protein